MFAPNSVNVARYASLIRDKSPTNWDAQMSESNFQTHPRALLRHAKSYFCRQNGPRSRKREKMHRQTETCETAENIGGLFSDGKKQETQQK
ncbi:DUF6783 domain-containing protein [Enterocloster lavalensis]|uniref:DUF6783 domain-containing protein n=1 Tax=Enterocloster lavalensis TaxID=460384 RepID=UPI003A7F28C6